MIITIAGVPGSGKTTVAKLIAKKLGYKHYSMGDIRGDIAIKHNMTIDELNEVGRKEAWPHKKADDYLDELGKTRDNLVIDTWVGFHFIPHSIKIFMDVDSDIGAQRVLEDQKNRPDENYTSLDEIKKVLKHRVNVCDEAYKRLYNISFLDKNNYDLVLDSSHKKPEEIAESILSFINKDE